MSGEVETEGTLHALTSLVSLLFGHRVTPLGDIKQLLAAVETLEPFRNPTARRNANDADLRRSLAITLDTWLPWEAEDLHRLGLPSSGAEREVWHNLLIGKPLEPASGRSFLQELSHKWGSKQPDLSWDPKKVRGRLRDQEAPMIARAILAAGRRTHEEPNGEGDRATVDLTKLPDVELLRLYLEGLADALDLDPWPTYLSARTRRLRPSRAAVPMALVPSGTWGRDLTDELRAQTPSELWSESDRLVIRGAGGTGKTWISRRLARESALTALARLDDGQTHDAIEIPMWVTAHDLVTMVEPEPLRLVSAALRQAPFHNQELRDQLARLLQRSLPRCAVFIDALDEASLQEGAMAVFTRIAALVPRILATTRTEAWRNHIYLDRDNPRHTSADLAPLAYPDGVEGLIDRWFESTNAPAQGRRLKEQLLFRPVLARAATTPIVCAMMCIAATEEVLPETQQELYDTVIECLLRSGWRKSGPVSDVLVGEARQLLESVARAGVRNDPNTNLGEVDEEIVIGLPEAYAEQVQLLVDTIAPRIPPLRTLGYRRQRRFIHRSFQEHLAARGIAGRPLREVEELLIPHLWFDAKWRGIVARAIAYHPDRVMLMGRLHSACAQLAGLVDAALEQLPEPSGQFAQLVCDVAALTQPDDWSELSGLFASARRQQIGVGALDVAGVCCAHWIESNGWAIDGVIDGLRRDRELPSPKALEVCRLLGPTQEQRGALRHATLTALVDSRRKVWGIGPSMTAMAMAWLLEGSISAEDRRLLEALLSDSRLSAAVAEAVRESGNASLVESQFARLMAEMESSSWTREAFRDGDPIRFFAMFSVNHAAQRLAITDANRRRVSAFLWSHRTSILGADVALAQGHLKDSWQLSDAELQTIAKAEPSVFVREATAPAALRRQCYWELWHRADDEEDPHTASMIIDDLTKSGLDDESTRRLLRNVWSRFADERPQPLVSGVFPDLLKRLKIENDDVEPSVSSTIWRLIGTELGGSSLIAPSLKISTSSSLDFNIELARRYLAPSQQADLVDFCLSELGTKRLTPDQIIYHAFLLRSLSGLEMREQGFETLLELAVVGLERAANSRSTWVSSLQTVVTNVQRRHGVSADHERAVVRWATTHTDLGSSMEWLIGFVTRGTNDDAVGTEAVNGVMGRLRSAASSPSGVAQKDAFVYARTAWGLANVGAQREKVRHDLTQLLESTFSEGLLAAAATIGLPSDILERVEWDLRSLNRTDLLRLLQGLRVGSSYDAWTRILPRIANALARP